MPFLLLMAMLGAEPAPSLPLLTLDQALKLGRENQPQLQQAESSSEAARARADQARAPLLPQLSANGAYERTTSNYALRPGTIPRGLSFAIPPPSWATYDYWTFGANLSQLVYDFGQSWDRWHAARANAAAQSSTERATRETVDYNVRNGFFSARAARALVGVAQETLTNQQQHLTQVEAFVQVGTHPEIDLAQARTNVANAKVQLITAQNGYATAKAQLDQAMGVREPKPYDVADEAPGPLEGEDKELGALLPEAIAARPELAALASQVQAQELTLRSSLGAYGPSLSVSTGINDSGQALNGLAWNWTAGAAISFPLYEGGLVQAQVREARANLSGLKAQLEGERQQVRLDLEQARLGVRATKESLVAAGDALTNAREQLRLAEGRYQTGAGSIIELSDAQLSLTNAAAQQVRAQYTLAQARAQLQKALGRQ